MPYIVDGDIALSQPPKGPLAAEIARFAEWARAQGYAQPSRHRQVLLAACFSQWLGHQGIWRRRITAEHSARYLRCRARRVKLHRGDAAALRQFLEVLRHEGVIPPVTVPRGGRAPVDRETQAFETYLRHERVLAEATIAYYVTFVHDFLADRFDRDRVTLARLCAGDVVRFVQRQAARLHVQRAKQLTTALRSFLHYARYRGDIVLDLAAAVPAVASWSMSSIPRAIPVDTVRQLLYLFVSNRGNRLDGGEIHRTFYALSRQIGLRGPTDRYGPRLHDLRHRFAGTTLLRWYRAGVDAERRLPILSAYLGHVHVSDTYWYLSAWPALMRAATSRLERWWEGQS